MSKAGRPSFHSLEFADVLESAGDSILGGLERAAHVPNHQPTRGGIREVGLRDFLRQLLPDRYYVGSGFTFDAADRRSRQLDIVIALEPPLSRVLERDSICYLPCEVVLAVIEVKTKLNAEEVSRAYTNAGSIRALQPFGVERFASARRKGAPLAIGDHRCFYSVVAFSSDLNIDGWAQREWTRAKRLAAASSMDPDAVDRVVIFDRGHVNTVDGRALDVPNAPKTVASQWFVYLWNHLERESERRKRFDPDIYMPGGGWEALS